MHHPTDRITHTTTVVTPVVEHWLEREIAQWVHTMKDRSEDPSRHERTLLPRNYISLPRIYGWLWQNSWLIVSKHKRLPCLWAWTLLRRRGCSWCCRTRRCVKTTSCRCCWATWRTSRRDSENLRTASCVELGHPLRYANDGRNERRKWVVFI